ncbi:DNA primase [Inconstantimicrobium mannanitabidum]|uniref:DNA primase n=1 Tax=Inconstantimicrobium mannanitabidum TaxID=1604901 RepID=A0ACB5R906_9CLOT|nr:DNA primase [Clostridium sp. TW13]GKX65590.1 DNA primase [Clostridium sp. TW13]
MQIPEEIIERIKEENDIVDIVSEVVKLKRAGRNYSGLCPFHHEKTPSFSVSPDKQIYKCFGCGEAGNTISFVMKTRNIGFVDAAIYLAERANIPLNLDEGKNKKLIQKKDLIIKVNTDAARFYFSNLRKNSAAKEYFMRRGINEKTINRFGLGFSMNNWGTLLTYLRGKGYKDQTIIEAGLAIKSERGTVFDRFRNRVMFPVFDYKGKVIGFGGRVLDDSKPKYLNSPETPVFNKGFNLYGLNYAIKNGLPEKYFIIVEGYMDCISLQQYGISNTVASLGTALTINQARLLKRYAEKVIISYDADLAGQKATLRGLDILRDVGFDVRVLTVPQGKDPDEFIRSNGKEAFMKLIENAIPLIEYRLLKAKEGIDFKDNTKVIEYGERVTEILANLNPVEKDVYIKKISEETGLREQSIYDMLSKKMTNSLGNLELENNNTKNGTKLYVEPAYVKAERSILKLMLQKEYYSNIIQYIEEGDFAMKSHDELYRIIKELVDNKEENLESKIEFKCQSPEILKEWISIKELVLVVNENDVLQEINDYMYEIKKFKLQEERKKIMKQLKQCEENNLFEESLNLVKAKKEIDMKLKNLNRS